MSLFTRTLERTALVFGLLAALALPAAADHHEGGDMAGAMPAMGAPEEMSRVTDMIGEWDVAMKFRMGPTEPWMDSKGTSKITSVLNGCALREDFNANMMGMPFQGLQMLSFNRETGEYNSLWIDDMSGKMSMTTGNFVDGDLVMTGEDMQGGAKYHMKNISHVVSKDEVHFTMEMSMDGGKNWFEGMEFVYTRAK